MIKLLIKLRKKTLLPFRWFLGRKKQEYNMDIPSPKEFIVKYKEEREKLVVAERTQNVNLIGHTKGALKILEWIIYGKSE